MNERTTLLDLTNITEEAQRWMREATKDATITFTVKQGSMPRGIMWGMTRGFETGGQADIIRAATKSELYDKISAYAQAARTIAQY